MSAHFQQWELPGLDRRCYRNTGGGPAGDAQLAASLQ
jgi:hypothetical protein